MESQFSVWCIKNNINNVEYITFVSHDSVMLKNKNVNEFEVLKYVSKNTGSDNITKKLGLSYNDFNNFTAECLTIGTDEHQVRAFYSDALKFKNDNVINGSATGKRIKTESLLSVDKNIIVKKGSSFWISIKNITAELKPYLTTSYLNGMVMFKTDIKLNLI